MLLFLTLVLIIKQFCKKGIAAHIYTSPFQAAIVP